MLFYPMLFYGHECCPLELSTYSFHSSGQQSLWDSGCCLIFLSQALSPEAYYSEPTSLCPASFSSVIPTILPFCFFRIFSTRARICVYSSHSLPGPGAGLLHFCNSSLVRFKISFGDTVAVAPVSDFWVFTRLFLPIFWLQREKRQRNESYIIKE